MPYTDLDTCAEAIKSLLTTNQTSLGLKSVVYGDQKVRATRPSALIAPIDEQRVIHGTNTFYVEFNILIYIVTDKVSLGMGDRQKSVIQLGQAVRTLLHQDKQWSGNLIFSFVRRTEYGVLGRAKGTDMVVGCRLNWMGMQETLFNV